MDLKSYLNMVEQYHPLIKIAQINQKKAQADQQLARGGFDPILSHQSSQKKMAGEDYYLHHQAQISIPTWYGIELSAGSEYLQGERLDASKSLGPNAYIGLNIPLLKNLLLDKRRAALAQAKIYNSMSSTERLLVSNNIRLQAAQQYWEWALAQKKLSIVKQNQRNSEARLQMVKSLVALGERAPIDSTEAVLQLQGFQIQAQDAAMNLQKEKFELNAFLWKENQQPDEVDDELMADVDWENLPKQHLLAKLDDWLEKTKTQHPDLQIYENKLQILGIDKKLKFQDLLPKLDLKYNHLSKSYNPLAGNGWLLENNFQYGIKLEFPLFFSQARAEYQKAQLKIDETQWAQKEKLNQLLLKTKYYHSQLLALQQIILNQEAVLGNYQSLLKAEEQKFQSGESTIFLINSRENKLIEAQLKNIELHKKYQQNYWGLQAASGKMDI